MVSMPRVAMNAGTRSSVTMSPFTQPTSAPVAMPKAIAGITPICGTTLIVMHPANAAVEPTERSKFPLAIASVMPNPTIATTLALVHTFKRLFQVKNVGVSTAKTAPTTSSVAPTGEKRNQANQERLLSIAYLQRLVSKRNPMRKARRDFHYLFLRHIIPRKLSPGFSSNKDDTSVS